MKRSRFTRRRVVTRAVAAATASLLSRNALAVFVPAQRQLELHVSPSGSDTAQGNADHPLLTVAAARDRLRHLKPQAGATVWLHSGAYNLDAPLELGPEDSGTAAHPIVFRAVPGPEPLLTTAHRISPAQLRLITNPATLARIAPDLHGKIVEIDLANLGLKHVERYPDRFDDNGGIVDLFLNDRRMPLARYPKQGYMQMKRVLINGGGMEAAGDWKQFFENGAPDQNKPRPGVFEYRDEHTARWISALDRGVWLKGYWRVPWQNEAVRVAKIDPEAHTITLAVPVQGGIGNKYHRPEGSGEENYWLLNLLEELTEPGEWCLDFADRKIYFYPPAGTNSGDLRIADNDAPVIHLNGASYISLIGIGISCSHSDGIAIHGGAGNRIAGCNIRNTTRYGARLEGGSRNEVVSSDIAHTGAGGIWLGGGDEQASPRVPAAHRAVNNHIHHFGEIELVYAPGINAGYTGGGGGGGGHHTAVAMYVANNMIHDGPHAGILHGSWDHIFEYNEIFRVCRVSNDMGYFYCFDLYPRSGNRTFRYNFMHNSPLADGIYFDADNREDRIYGNVVHVGAIAYLFKLGVEKANPLQIFCWNNIAVDCKTGFRFAMRQGSDVHDNAAVSCKTPYIYLTGNGGKGPDPLGDLSTGKNIAYTADPGFVDAASGNFALKADSSIFKDLKFHPIPTKRIGLYRDEFRTTLPSDESVQRFKNPAEAGSAYDIRDR